MTDELFRNDSYLKECDATVVAIDDNALILDRTVFYPEGGGQVGDVGEAAFGDERLEVVDTYRVENRIAHRVPWTSKVPAEEAFSRAKKGRLAVDAATRLATARNQGASHAGAMGGGSR